MSTYLNGLGSLPGGVQDYDTGSLAAPFSVYSVVDDGPDGIPGETPGPFRPPNWGNGTQQYMLTVTLPSGFQPSDINPAPTNQSGLLGTVPSGQTSGSPSGTSGPQNFFFDAIPQADHDQRYTPTKHPVQTGAAVSDHIYREPAVVTLEILASDALDSFVQNQYSSANSKSISMYQTLKYIASLKTPIVLTTRLDTYSNMLIMDIRASDTRETQFGLRVWVTFSEIIPATVSTSTININPTSQPTTSSARSDAAAPSTTQSATPTKPSQSTTNNFQIPPVMPAPSGPPATNGYPSVPGSGSWSSLPSGGGAWGSPI